MMHLRDGQGKAMLGLISFFALAAVACQANGGSPIAPAPSGLSAHGSAASPYGGHAVPLAEAAGSLPAGATGTLNITQTDVPGANNFEVAINVHGGPPDADLYFQILGDVAPATRGDGICNPAPFPAPPVHAGLDAGILHTSPAGTASTHIKFPIAEGTVLGAFESGVKSDFKYRVASLSESFDLRSPCVVLMGK